MPGYDHNRPMILAFDCATAACTAALFGARGECLGQRDEVIGRGHAERLVPMIAELLNGRTPGQILVGVGPGSFTGIRVAIAAAQGLVIGWNARLNGLSSLALLAATALEEETDGIAAAMIGGHGQLFVQQFGPGLTPVTMAQSLTPADAAKAIDARLVVGSGAAQLIGLRGYGEAREAQPAAAAALRLPEALRTLPPKPVYARAPDARPAAAA